jgi:hypothetical protein
VLEHQFTILQKIGAHLGVAVGLGNGSDHVAEDGRRIQLPGEGRADLVQERQIPRLTPVALRGRCRAS